MEGPATPKVGVTGMSHVARSAAQVRAGLATRNAVRAKYELPHPLARSYSRIATAAAIMRRAMDFSDIESGGCPNIANSASSFSSSLPHSSDMSDEKLLQSARSSMDMLNDGLLERLRDVCASGLPCPLGRGNAKAVEHHAIPVQ